MKNHFFRTFKLIIMSKKFLRLILFVSLITGFVFQGKSQTLELFFSEYAEGSSNHKYLEIFNGTGDSVLLDNYVILVSSNGGTWNAASTHRFPKGKYIKNNDVWVIGNSQADAAIKAESDEIIAYSTSTLIVSFNGNDTRGLAKIVAEGTTETDTLYSTDTLYVQTIDFIGRYDLINPGTGWAVAGTANATADKTLVRKSAVNKPNSNWDAAAGTDAINSEWIVNPQNTWTDIGKHTYTPPTQYDKLVINEILADGSTSDDWIEIFNPNAKDVSLKDWFLSDDSSNYNKWTFPDTMIKSGAYLVIYANNVAATKALEANFALSKNGEEVLLSNPNKEMVDYMKFGAQKQDTSYSRIPNGTGNFAFAKPTPDAANELFPKPIPSFTISQINKVNAQGVADSLNVYCKLEGVVFSQSFHATNQQFWMDDGTGAINVFQYSSAGITYKARPGDKIKAIGKIAQYRGLLEIMPDSIVVLDSNKTQVSPLVVTKLDENAENMLVKIMNLMIVDTTSKAASGMNVRATNGTDTFVVRIDDLCEAFDTNFVDTSFNLIGIGGQFSSTSSAPFLDGYQINPRYISDFELHQPNSVPESPFYQLIIYPNPNNGSFNIVNPFLSKVQYAISDITGKVVENNISESAIIQINNNLDAGIYMIHLKSENSSKVYTNRLFVY